MASWNGTSLVALRVLGNRDTYPGATLFPDPASTFPYGGASDAPIGTYTAIAGATLSLVVTILTAADLGARLTAQIFFNIATVGTVTAKASATLAINFTITSNPKLFSLTSAAITPRTVTSSAEDLDTLTAVAEDLDTLIATQQVASAFVYPPQLPGASLFPGGGTRQLSISPLSTNTLTRSAT